MADTPNQPANAPPAAAPPPAASDLPPAPSGEMGPPNEGTFWATLIRATQTAGARATRSVGMPLPEDNTGANKPRGKSTSETDPTLEVTDAAITEQRRDKAHVRRMRLFLAGATVVTFWGELYGMYRLLWVQGSHKDGFQLNDWLIGTVANGIIIQTILVLIIIAADLYPKGGDTAARIKEGNAGGGK